MSAMSSKSVCVITGASRGIGRSIAVNFASILPEGSLIIALSRNTEALKKTQSLCSEANPDITCTIHCYDQGCLDEKQYDSVLGECLHNRSAEEFDQAMIFHNAGSLESEMCRDLTDVQFVASYMNINVSGLMALNAQFQRVFKNVASKVVVNISSLAAMQPFASWSLYCIGKAAREMYMRVLAVENPAYRVLNYAPGPIDTDMFRNKCLIETKDPEHLQAIKGMEKALLSPDTTVKRLIEILDKNTFENGAHIDYFDEF